MKIHDIVRVISGDNKGKEAKIVKIDRKNGKACLEGIGEVERHMKKSYLNPKGGKKTVHLGIDMSNLKLVKSAEPVKKADAKTDTKKADAKAARSEAKAAKKAEKKAKKGAK